MIISYQIINRFDEISMEINATSQEFDMNDEEHSKQFSEVLEILSAVSFNGEGRAPGLVER